MNRVTGASFQRLALSLLIVSLSGCNSFSGGRGSTAPAIASFTASPAAVTVGEEASLTAVFSSGTGVITPGNLPVTSGTAVSVSPAQTTVYTLTVTNGTGGSATRSATVTVNPAAPTITSFTATPATIATGGAASLTGVFANGAGVITPGNLTATSGTAVSVSPTGTTTYTLTVTNSAGVAASKTATVTVLAAQTISFANPGSQTVGTPLALVATASSGLTVSFASTTTSVCTVSGAAASFVAAGTCSITASQAGSATYEAAMPVSQSFTVKAALLAQTITFANPGTQTMGTAVPALAATASSGLAVSFNSQTTGICTVSGAAVTLVAAGTCTIQATQEGNATYAAATPVSQSFTVNASGLTAQTITFANPGTQTVGTPLMLVATASSGLTVSFASSTSSVCTVSGTTADFIAAGNCTITASQAGNATYAAATPVSQSFTVNAATTGNTIAYSSCPSPAGSGITYTIGLLNSSGQPSGPQMIAEFTHWNNLNPGDVVCIYGKSTPYAERLVLTRSGSDDSHRVRIVGVVQNGYEPILTGKSATTADAFNYGVNISQYYEGGEVSVTGLNYGTPVAYLNIEGLTIQGATTAEVGGTVASPAFSTNTYSDPNINGGAQSAWGCGSAGINLLRSDHISIIHNRIRDNDNGIFVNSNNGNTSSNVLIEYNHIYGNGVSGNTVNTCGQDSHGTYTEAENITYLGNRFGALRQGQAVNLLKDRSSGLVVAYNLFLPDGVFEASLGDALLVGSKPGPIGHLLDLVESYDTSVGPPGGLQSLGTAYENVSVYGNIFFDDGAAADGSQGAEDAVHFGGDQGNSAVYRKHLHYYNNTVVARRGDGVGWLEMEPTTDAGAWNNIFYAAYVGSSTPPSFNLLSTWCYDKQYGYTCGTVNYLGQNWNSPIWGVIGVNGSGATPSFVNLASNDVHIATSDATIVGNGQTGDSAYPANSTTVPIEYADFLTTIARPFSQIKIDLGALGYSGGTSLLAQTITFANPGTQTVGTPLVLVATASSGLTVSFASTTTSVCTVSGTTAIFIIAGTCSITASQAGNATYAAATPVTQSFNVNAAPPVLVASITIPSAATVAVAASTTITATVLPANAANKTLTWTSSDTTIATVSAMGVVTGVQQGSAIITATAIDGSGVVSNNCTVTVTPAISTQSNYFGINIGTNLDWDTNRMFADAMKSSRAWGTSSNAGDILPTSALDANGWPMQDASLYVWAGIGSMNGSYALSFSGQATVVPSSGSITNLTYNSSANLTTANLAFSDSSSTDTFLTLKFTNTRRTSSSSTNSGITNVVLMRPNSVGSATPLASTQIFNPPFLASLNDFAALRTMDYSATNGNEIVHWSDRTRPGDASQAIGNPGVPAGGWEGPGGAWEYAILLANQTSKDLWINVPLNADNDYITKLAQLMKFGSDGTTPYTTAQTSPVWPGLNPNLHLYVEFSNEVWNTAGAFAGTENHTEAVNEVNAGGSPLNFDGDTNDWNWAWRRPAEKTVEISTIFRTVWGDAAMMTTVRPVLESQLGYADGPLLQEMHLMVDYYYNPAKVSSPQSPSYYIYGLGGSAYYNPTDKTSVDSIFSTMATGFASAVQGDVDYALPFGVRRIAYEGGPSLDSTGNSSEDANQAAAWADPRMEQVIETEQNIWSQANGDLLVYFCLTSNYQWAFVYDVLTPTSPKMSGIADILASPRSASTYGTPIPATLVASNANVPPAWLWSDGNNKMHDYKWTGFSVLVSTQGVFTVSLNANSATSGAQAEILIDGNSIGTVTVPASGNSAALSTPTLSAGSHGILVRSFTGTFNLIHVIVGAVTPTAQTITFNNPGTQTVGTPLTLVATSTSGLTVMFASTTTGVCTVSGTMATFVATGTCSITASQAGDSTYAAATPVPQSFTVDDATISGDPTVGVLPSYNDTYANWKNAGLALVGGIPARTTVCATVNPLGPGQDDYTNVQTAIDNCPAGEVVQLAAGAFSIKLADMPIHLSRGITLRGTGVCGGTSSPYCQTYITVTDGILPYQVSGFSPLCGTNSSTGVACPNGGEPEILISPVAPDYNYSWEQCGNVGGPTGLGCGAKPLTADAAQGQTTIQLASTTGISVGSWVLIDEASGAGWVTDPMNKWTGYGSVWAASDWLNPSGSPATGRVMWQKDKNQGSGNGGDFGVGSGAQYPYQANSPGCWRSYCDRPTAELHKVASIGAGPCPGTDCTVTFDDPLTVAFRQSGGHNAQVYANLYGNNSGTGPTISFLEQAGVENLSLLRSPTGGIEMELCANCWVKNTEVGDWYGGGIGVDYSVRSELNEVYIHDCWDSVNSGGEYGFELENGSTEMLLTNSIINFAGKNMVAEAGGAGSVVSYNYMDDTMYDDNSGIGDYWVETGADATHYSGPHHILFEGNWSDNFDADNTHGNSMYITYFRNVGSGLRTAFTDSSLNKLVDDFAGKAYYCPTSSCVSNPPGPFRAAGPMGYNYWFAFVGNVLGTAGKTTAANGWSYSGDFTGSRIFMLGWDGGNGGQDPYLDGTLGSYILINGNYDYLNNSVTWQGSPLTLPNSFYLAGKPAFFTVGDGYTWPWVIPTGSEQIQNGPTGCGGTCSGLPAQARWQAGTPFVQP